MTQEIGRWQSCTDCDLEMVPGTVPDPLTSRAFWQRVVGDPEIVLCITCLERRASALGLRLSWVPVIMPWDHSDPWAANRVGSAVIDGAVDELAAARANGR